MSSVRTISPSEFQQLREASSSIALIDVRTPGEYASVHADAAVNIPLDRVSASTVHAYRGDVAAPLYIICKSGARAGKACQKLIDEGVAGVVNVAGGTDAWIDAGLPVVRGEGGISLERQVRVAAGALVLTGVLLSVLVHPYCLAFTAVVGAGLIFAGITGWCGLGLAMARLPWNRRGISCSM